MCIRDRYAFHLGYERLINQKNTVSVKTGRSFRYPNIDERVGSGWVSASHNFRLASQNSYDFEFGHKYLDDKIKVQTNFYYMRLRSEIKYDNSKFTNRNLARTHRYGIENKTDFKINEYLTLTNSFSIAQSKYRAGHRRDFDLSGVPAFKNVSDLEFKIREYFNLSGSVYYQSSQRMINDEEADESLKNALDMAKTPHNTVDNVLRVHSLRPSTMIGHMKLYKSVLHDKMNTIPEWFQETISSYVSIINNCKYSLENHWKNASDLINDKSKGALCIIIFLSFIKFIKSLHYCKPS